MDKDMDILEPTNRPDLADTELGFFSYYLPTCHDKGTIKSRSIQPGYLAVWLTLYKYFIVKRITSELPRELPHHFLWHALRYAWRYVMYANIHVHALCLKLDIYTLYSFTNNWHIKARVREKYVHTLHYPIIHIDALHPSLVYILQEFRKCPLIWLH